LTIDPASELTILTVALQDHVPYVIANHRLQRRLSPGRVSWWVVDNDDGAVARALAVAGLEDVVVLPGVSRSEIPVVGAGSYQHGMALNLMAAHCPTRFLLVLDPDLYLLCAQWAADVLEYMDSTNTAFFGVPWHPVWYGKYRSFPSVHCMFIDTRSVPVHELDFRPALSERPVHKLSSRAEAGAPVAPGGTSLRKVLQAAATLLRVLYHLTLLRRQIGQTWDTGRAVREGFGDRRATVADVVAPREDFRFPFHLRTSLGWWLERVLPGRWSFVPRGYVTSRSFTDLGLPSGREHGWEEFLWRGAPFALHVRRTKQSRSDVGALRDLEELLVQVGGR
jgi:hypothetical protein